MIDYIVFALFSYHLIRMHSRQGRLDGFWLAASAASGFTVGSRNSADLLLALMALFLVLRVGRRRVTSKFVVPALAVILGFAAMSIVAGVRLDRVLVRMLYYIGVLGLLDYCLYRSRSVAWKGTLHRGVVFWAIVNAVYSVYQVLAESVGLPYRGIVRIGRESDSLALAGGFFRINGLQDEPKRAAVLFIVGWIILTHGKERQWQWVQSRKRLWQALILVCGVLTFSTSALVVLPVAFLAHSVLTRRLTGARLAGAVLMGAITLLGLNKVMESTLTLTEFGSASASDQIAWRIRSAMEGEEGGQVRQEAWGLQALKDEPALILTGAGLGGSNDALHRRFGHGVGRDLSGRLKPFNSELMSIGFDFGLPVGLLLLWLLLVSRPSGWSPRQPGDVTVSSYLVLQLMTLSVLPLTVLLLASGRSGPHEKQDRFATQLPGVSA